MTRHRLLIAALVAAVGTGWSAPVSAQDCPIRIGGMAPLSAPGAVTGGEAMRHAMMIALEEINAAGGVLGCEVELVVSDTEGLPERGAAVMERLISQDNVVAVGGGYHSSVGVASMRIAHDNNIPVVFSETWSDQITAEQLPQIFRIAPLSSEVSAVFARFATTVPGVEKVVIVTENTDYGIPASQETQEGLKAGGVDSVIFTVDIGTQDFAGIIQRISAENPDMIITLLTGEASYNFTQQAADAGIGPQDIPFYCDQTALESGAYWINVPDGNYCFMNRIGLPVDSYTEVTHAFVDKYKERTGKEAAESYAMAAYDSIRLIARAIEEAGSTDADAIIDALESIEYHGALGKITFPYGRNNPPEAHGLDAKWWHQFPDPAITVLQYQEQGQDSTVMPVVYPEAYKSGEPIWVHQ
jgi:branched-chain amino acid transport system substrate-binding protein